MFATLAGGFKAAVRRGCAVTSLLLLCWPILPSFAEAPSYCAVFCGSRDQLLDAPITPIQQLENHELFLSAAAMRDNRLSMHQRLLNYAWLHDSTTRIHGGRVWSRFLRHSLVQLRAKNRNSQEQDVQYLDNGFETRNVRYRLRLSDDYVRISMRYDF